MNLNFFAAGLTDGVAVATRTSLCICAAVLSETAPIATTAHSVAAMIETLMLNLLVRESKSINRIGDRSASKDQACSNAPLLALRAPIHLLREDPTKSSAQHPFHAPHPQPPASAASRRTSPRREPRTRSLFPDDR